MKTKGNMTPCSIFAWGLLCLPISIFSEVTFKSTHLNPTTQEISISFDLNAPDYIYQDFLSLSADQPHITLSEWHTSEKAVSHFDPTFNNQKMIFDKPFTLSVIATSSNPQGPRAHLRLAYLQHSQKKIKEQGYPLVFPSQEGETHDDQENSAAPIIKTCTIPKKTISWSEYFQNIVTTTHSLWIRILFALLLGLLLSLTPCIYPMIPITVGILQANASKNVLRNFLLAGSYTLGIATMFALLGLLAAFTGHVFGSFMHHPLVILTIVGFLIYLSFSMLGFYEMYVPQFLNGSRSSARGGSFIAAFTFGALSGTVASPCLSPGLLLLLTLVTTMGSILTGFILLFSFGIGLSIPLLIIGTFSNSLNALPRAGMWMVEIKKIFGLMMLGMCFYFVRPLLSAPLFMASLTLFCIIAGIYCIRLSVNQKSFAHVYSMMGIGFIAFSVFLGIKSYQITYAPLLAANQGIAWITDYHTARNTALQKGTPIFLYVSGPFCSICKAIEKKILMDPLVQDALQNFVLLKVENMHGNPDHMELCKRFKVIGVPTFILFSPVDESICNRWDSKLYDRTAVSFAQELK